MGYKTQAAVAYWQCRRISSNTVVFDAFRSFNIRSTPDPLDLIPQGEVQWIPLLLHIVRSQTSLQMPKVGRDALPEE